MKIAITQEMRSEAGEYQRAVLARVRGDNYTGLVKPSRYYDGRLAELVFAAACVEQELPARWLGNADGRPDPGADFQVDRLRVDVKYVPAAGFRFMHSMLELARNHNPPDLFVPVQVWMEKESATVQGYFTYADVRAMPTRDGDRGAPYRWAPLTNARPVEELWRELGVAYQAALL